MNAVLRVGSIEKTNSIFILRGQPFADEIQCWMLKKKKKINLDYIKNL